MNLNDFNFSLPESLIAQHPVPRRDQSRMMVVFHREARWEHRVFSDLPDILGPQHFLVLNTTRVFPARLRAQRRGKAERIEILLAREEAPGDWSALIKPARKAPLGGEIEIHGLCARVVGVRDNGIRILRFTPADRLPAIIEQFGEPPLPPYIRRTDATRMAEDRVRYQTVYARQSGSVAAPTAGLHFTPKVLSRLEAAGVSQCRILLHVGYGTFQPIRCEIIEAHRMEPEYYEVAPEEEAALARNKKEGRQLIAVGTTTTRVLEFLARRENSGGGASGFCDLFIYPGFEFRAVDGLLTNFHLPRSTLFLLVCAFGGKDLMFECYQEAVREKYRFFSYGDCMLIL